MPTKDNYPAAWFRAHQIKALEILLSGQPLTSDVLHDGKEPPLHHYWGALFRTPEITRVAVPDDVPVKSLRTRGWVQVWRLKPGAVETARETLAALKADDGNELGQVA